MSYDAPAMLHNPRTTLGQREAARVKDVVVVELAMERTGNLKSWGT